MVYDVIDSVSDQSSFSLTDGRVMCVACLLLGRLRGTLAVISSTPIFTYFFSFH